DGARQPSRPPAPPAAPEGPARRWRVRAHRVGRGARRGRAPDAARARHVRPGRDPRLLAHGQPLDAAQRARHRAAAAAPLWRLHDQAFLDRHVLGFDEAHLPPGAPEGASYRSYLLGLADGVRKTPEWAAAITGMPAETIRRLAIEYATTKPAALQCGYAPGRTINGEQFHRAAYALAAITGSVGTPGGNSGVSNGATGRGGIKSLPPG